MEPQVNINCRKRENRRCCIDLILVVLLILLAFAFGLLIGALTSLIIFLGIGSLITFIAVLILLIIIRIIMLICKENRRCC